MSTFIEESYVEEIRPVKYGIETFPGYGWININFSELKRQIENSEWKSHLGAVSGIYLITDTNNNMKYVGSAYSERGGIYTRWKNYLESDYDQDEEESGEKFPNSQLKKIAKDKTKGMDYIRKYFKFSILETIPQNFTKEYVISRENHWKEVLNTRNGLGYNSN